MVVKKLELDEKSRYLAIFTDITLLVKQFDEIKIKDELLIAQSRQAAMGELLGMIAHQWKQPLSVLSMIAANSLVDIELNENLDPQELEANAKDILNQVDYLSKTIDEFRDFLKPGREKEYKHISVIINNTIKIVGKALENKNINLVLNIKNDPELHTYTKELKQVLINILNNSRDAFEEQNIQDREIKITAEEEEGYLHLCIHDNAGGVQKEILPKIFNSYFTTKDEDKGTGIGLYMVKNIVMKNLEGTVQAFNRDGGLAIKILLPMHLN